jgi:hypothetical protein
MKSTILQTFRVVLFKLEPADLNLEFTPDQQGMYTASLKIEALQQIAFKVKTTAP